MRAGLSSSLFAQYERPSLLARINPVVKLAVALGYMMAATAIFDAATLAALLVLALGLTAIGGRVPLRVLGRGLLPFVVFALGYLWMNSLFPRQGSGASLFVLGPLRVDGQGLANGATMGLRALCFGGHSLLFVSTTDPTLFALSLVRQAGLSPKTAYSLLAAYRLLPLLESELRQIRAAHRMRGVGEGDGLRGKVLQIYRYTLPLLAGSLRRAGRIAAAMESRGFDGSRDRTWYRDVRVARRDWLYAVAMAAALAAVLVAAGSLRTLTPWSGRLWG